MLQMDVQFKNFRAYSGYEIDGDGVVKVSDKSLGFDTVKFTTELASKAFKDFLDIAGNFPPTGTKSGETKVQPIYSSELKNKIICFYNNYGPLIQPQGIFGESEQHFHGIIKQFNQMFAADDYELNVNVKQYGVLGQAFKTYASPQFLLIYFLWLTYFPTKSSWVVCKYRLIKGEPRKRNKGIVCPANCILSNRKGKLWGPGCRQAYYERKEQ